MTGDGSADIALIWLPAPAEPPLASRVLVTEPRWVALPAAHRLAGNEEVAFAELLDEPFFALPYAAGTVRDHWPAMDQRAGHRHPAGRGTVPCPAGHRLARRRPPGGRSRLRRGLHRELAFADIFDRMTRWKASLKEVG